MPSRRPSRCPPSTPWACAGGRGAVGAGRAACRQFVDGRLRGARRRRAGSGTVLPVSQRIPAGAPGHPLQPGTAARIFTGGQVPAGADAVVMQEQCEPIPATDAGMGGVRIDVLPQHGFWIRRRGEDVRLGAAVLHRGARLTPQAAGSGGVGRGGPAAGGTAAARGAVLHRRRTHDARRNRCVRGRSTTPTAIPARPAAGGRLRGQRPRHRARQLDATRSALRAAAAANDLIVTSGGVSVGEEDHLKPAAMAEGRLEQWQIAIKPGKPLAFGEIGRGDGSAALLLGLPGNPVSSSSPTCSAWPRCCA